LVDAVKLISEFVYCFISKPGEDLVKLLLKIDDFALDILSYRKTQKQAESENYYSYPRTEEEKKKIENDEIGKWAKTFVDYLIDNDQQTTISCEARIEELLITVIVEAFPSGIFPNLEIEPCKKGGTNIRKFFAYSISARELLSILKYLIKKYDNDIEENIGHGSLKTFFLLVCEFFSDYSVSYPQLISQSKQAIENQLIEVMKSKQNELDIHTSNDDIYKDIKLCRFSYLFLNSEFIFKRNLPR
jgi:hypothetical protein